MILGLATEFCLVHITALTVTLHQTESMLDYKRTFLYLLQKNFEISFFKEPRNEFKLEEMLGLLNIYTDI